MSSRWILKRIVNSSKNIFLSCLIVAMLPVHTLHNPLMMITLTPPLRLLIHYHFTKVVRKKRENNKSHYYRHHHIESKNFFLICATNPKIKLHIVITSQRIPPPAPKDCHWCDDACLHALGTLQFLMSLLSRHHYVIVIKVLPQIWRGRLFYWTQFSLYLSLSKNRCLRQVLVLKLTT